MIDYLEQFFREQEKTQEQPAISAPVAAAETEPVILPAQPQTEPTFHELSPKQPRSVDVFQTLTVQTVEPELTDPGQARPTLPISRPGVEGETWTLERRLRREARRYDSGFYWY